MKQPPTPKQRIRKVRPRPEPALPSKDEQEFGRAAAGVIVCPECQCTFYRKAWHPALRGYREQLLAGKPVSFRLCPADQWKKEKRYEGQVIITLSQPTPEAIENVKNIIRNSDKQAQDRDPMDRVLWTENGGGLLKVHTSENQLAVRIGKKLKSSFRKSTLKITHSRGEDVIRVYWNH